MHASHRSVSAQQKCVQRHVEETDSYAFFNLLTGPRMLEGVKEQLPAHRERLFPPTETLSMFLAQVLSADGSCQQAVNDAALKRVIEGLSPCSSKTSAYCQARARLPTEMITALTCQVGGMITENVHGHDERKLESAIFPALTRDRSPYRQVFPDIFSLGHHRTYRAHTFFT